MPVFLCMFFGIRRGEMLGLKWSDVDFDKKIIHIQRTATPCKGGYVFSETKSDSSDRFLQLRSVVERELCNKQQESGLFSEDGFININAKGEIISASELQKEFKKP